MSDWNSGYVTEIDYTYGYYAEVNPLRCRLAFLNAGLVPPEIGTACELGFGQGLTVNAHAAASIVKWHGTDFNPAQVGFANELARATESDVELFDEGFDQFCIRTDLPDFDYIGLHGIWSWISDENRGVIVDFIRRKLKVGGVVYISYNTLPGWSAIAPLRDLLSEHAQVYGADGNGIVNRINGAFGFVDQLFATNPLYARSNPQVVEHFQAIKEKNREYVAHEFFNRHWQPMGFSDIARWLQPAKLQWVCSADFRDAIDVLNLTPAQQALLGGISDPAFRESVRDFCVNRKFRKDYWVKGSRALTPLERSEGLRAQLIVLTQPREDVSLKVTVGQGEATLQKAVYGPILDQLADYVPKTLGQLADELGASEKGKGIVFDNILEAALLLSAIGVTAPVHGEAIAEKVRERTRRLNTILMMKARGSSELGFLVSPLTGGGVGVPRFPQLFLLAKEQGLKRPDDWAAFVWKILAVQNQRLMKDGKTLMSDEENMTELTAQANIFAGKPLQLLKALQIA